MYAAGTARRTCIQSVGCRDDYMLQAKPECQVGVVAQGERLLAIAGERLLGQVIAMNGRIAAMERAVGS